MSGPRDLEEAPRVIWNIAAVFRLEPQYVRRYERHIASDPYRAWTRPFGPARAERTDVITRGDNRCRRGGKKSPARECADTINKSFFNAGSAMDSRGLTPALETSWVVISRTLRIARRVTVTILRLCLFHVCSSRLLSDITFVETKTASRNKFELRLNLGFVTLQNGQSGQIMFYLLDFVTLIML